MDQLAVLFEEENIICGFKKRERVCTDSERAN